MTITLDLQPELEARLIAHATAQGISVEDLVKQAIAMLLTPSEEWVETLEAFCNHPALADVPPLSDEAIDRESIYREREDRQL